MNDITPDRCKTCALFCNSEYFCAKLLPDELIDLNKHSRTITLKRGQSFNDEALEQWPIVAVASGVISIQHLLEDGRKSISALFMAGDIIDLRDISNRNRGGLIALSKVDVCRLSPAVFEDLVHANPRAQKIVWDNLREQAFRAIDHSADLAKKQALEKLASFVFECSHRQPLTTGNVAVDIPIRRVDLAEYLGMQPETVSRCFRELESKNIISLKTKSTIIIENVPALRRIASGDKSAINTNYNHNPVKYVSFG